MWMSCRNLTPPNGNGFTSLFWVFFLPAFWRTFFLGCTYFCASSCLAIWVPRGSWRREPLDFFSLGMLAWEFAQNRRDAERWWDWRAAQQHNKPKTPFLTRPWKKARNQNNPDNSINIQKTLDHQGFRDVVPELLTTLHCWAFPNKKALLQKASFHGRIWSQYCSFLYVTCTQRLRGCCRRQWLYSLITMSQMSRPTAHQCSATLCGSLEFYDPHRQDGPDTQWVAQVRKRRSECAFKYQQHHQWLTILTRD